MTRADTHYARSGDVHIAYQVVGDGPIDVVFVQGFISNLEIHWEDPGLTHLFNRLGGFARLILFDKRGSGLSDRVGDMPNLETRMDDVRAVMDAAGSRQAVLIGASEGGPMSILFGATYPDRTRALVLYGAYAHFHSWVLTEAQVEAFVAGAETTWGDGSSLKSFAPNLVNNERFRAWWARFERLGTSPAGAIALARMNSRIDVRDILPVVRVPTLIIHRANDARVNVEAGRYLAHHIPDARYVEIPGTDHPIWVGDTDRVVDEIQEFLTGVRPEHRADRVLATVLCADLAPEGQRGGAQARSLLDRIRRFRELAGSVLPSHHGRLVGRGLEGVLATFDGPVRALRCALAIRDAAGERDMPVRAGIHMGEVEIAGEDAVGLPLRLAARIASVARPGEILVTRTVRDIVVGSDLRFADAGNRLPEERNIPRLLLINAAAGPASCAHADALTEREREILGVVAAGMTNAQIAKDLHISEHTVKRHVASILDKLSLPNRAAAAAFAAQNPDATGTTPNEGVHR